MTPLQPILVISQFRAIHHELIELLEGLAPKDWNLPTVCAGWTVKDIAAHLLGGDLGRLSTCRDGLQPASAVHGHSGLVGYVNQLNAEWVRAARRISPRLLIDMIRTAGTQANEYWSRLDPNGRACFPVSWAGESESKTWFDLAREYTERWHHQQQIRDAVSAPGLTSREWLHPVLDTFMRALPVGYSALSAEHGVTVCFDIAGEAGGEWMLRRSGNRWELLPGTVLNPAATIATDQDTAWRIFTKGLAREAAAQRIAISGDPAFGPPLLSTLAVLA